MCSLQLILNELKILIDTKKNEKKPIYSAGDLKCKAIIIITGFSLLTAICGYN
jgi:hypothetical protein